MVGEARFGFWYAFADCYGIGLMLAASVDDEHVSLAALQLQGFMVDVILYGIGGGRALGDQVSS